MVNKVQKIREEVVRLKSQLLRGACSSQVAMETHCKEEAYNEVLAILDTMQEEPFSNKTEKAIDELSSSIADELTKQLENNLKEEPVSEDLEQTIDTYLATYWGGEKEKKDWPFLKKMAIHFANWQKEQILDCNTTLQRTFELGKQEMKQQMIKDAVKGTTKFVGEGDDKMVKFVCGDLNPEPYYLNQRVKLIIIKED